jgi:4-hydroxybenzoyl-CoA thioesterase
VVSRKTPQHQLRLIRDSDENWMRITRRPHFIEFGDCDPAGIVYFPRYLEWFDAALQNHFRQAGLAKASIIEKYGFVAFPMVDLKVTYSLPSTFHEEVVIETAIVEMRRSSFVTRHRLLRNDGKGGESVAVEAMETRVWAGRHPEDPARFQGVPIPDEVRQIVAG